MCNTHQQYIFAYSLTLAILEHVTEYSPNLIKQCMFLSWIKYKLYSITVSSVCLFYSSTITSDVKQLEARFAFFELFTTLAFALCIFFVFFNAHVLSLQKGIKGEKTEKIIWRNLQEYAAAGSSSSLVSPCMSSPTGNGWLDHVFPVCL